MAATGSAANGEMPCSARISTKYAPRPTNACCPTDTRPAYPASRFHMQAIVSTSKACTKIVVVPAYTRYGGRQSTTTTTSAPAQVHATFLRDRVTRNFSAERAVVSVTVLIGLSGR